jgi:dTDP-glucose pyrophosphorylase
VEAAERPEKPNGNKWLATLYIYRERVSEKTSSRNCLENSWTCLDRVFLVAQKQQ